MKIERKQVGWGFWLWWVLASFVGWTVGSFVSDEVGDVMGAVWFDSLGLIVLGATIGGMQWLVLHRHVSWAGRWAVANIAGWIVGAAMNLPAGLAVGWGVGLVVAGVLQWLVLRLAVARAAWWLLVTFVEWVVGVTLAMVIPGCQGWCSGSVFGVVVGTLTGGALIWLLRQPIPKE